MGRGVKTAHSRIPNWIKDMILLKPPDDEPQWPGGLGSAQHTDVQQDSAAHTGRHGCSVSL